MLALVAPAWAHPERRVEYAYSARACARAAGLDAGNGQLATPRSGGICPAVLEVAAVSMPDAVLGGRVCVYVVTRPGTELTWRRSAGPWRTPAWPATRSPSASS